MLVEIHDILKKLLEEKGHISAQDVTVEFVAPTSEWVESRSVPTLNLYLYDFQENMDLRHAGYEHATKKEGSTEVATRRAPPRRFDFKYMVTAICSSIEDEHNLLWRTVSTFLKFRVIPEELLPSSIRDLGVPVSGRIGQADERMRGLDFWSSFRAQPRPSMQYIITMPMDPEIEIVSPLVLTRALHMRPDRVAPVPIALVPAPEFTETLSDDGPSFHVGGTVRDRNYEPVAGVRLVIPGRRDETTDAMGRFVIARVKARELKLEVHAQGLPPLQKILQIPADSYDVVLND